MAPNLHTSSSWIRILFIFLSARFAYGATIYVNEDATGSNDGSTWEHSYTKLQDALAVATAGDSIWVAEGTYYPDEGDNMVDNDRNSTFNLIEGVELYGGFYGNENLLSERSPDTYKSILSGDLLQDDDTLGDTDNAYHVLRGDGETVAITNATILDGFTITAGNANGDADIIEHSDQGGGLFLDHASPSIRNCSFEENQTTWQGGGIYSVSLDGSASSTIPLTMNECSFSGNSSEQQGGAVWIYSGAAASPTPILLNCTFQSNVATYFGGGVYINGTGFSPTIEDCLFQGNTSIYGAGIYNLRSSSTITGCSFLSNLGNGVSNKQSDLIIENCTFERNRGNLGLGVRNNFSSVEIRNCSFLENISSQSGGGIHNYNSSLILENTSFVANTADDEGGAICNTGDIVVPVEINNCSFLGNSANKFPYGFGGAIFDGSTGSSFKMTNCSIQGNSARKGGGIFFSNSSDSILNNCSIQGNAADAEGGGIFFNHSSNSILNNCSIQGNAADAEGGGIYSDTEYINLTNCLIWQNSANNSTTAQVASYQGPIANTSSIRFSHCLFENWNANELNYSRRGIVFGNNLDGTDSSNAPRFVRAVDPLSAPTTGGDLRVLAGSPTIGAGDGTITVSTNTTTTDLAGNSRFDGTIDLGAYEGIAGEVSFSYTYPSLDPDDDANNNGYSNFIDYAAGFDPSASHPHSAYIQLKGNQLTFSFRNNAADVYVDFQQSPDLTPDSWTSMIEGIDYNPTGTVDDGERTLYSVEIDITAPRMFFKEVFSSSP